MSDLGGAIAVAIIIPVLGIVSLPFIGIGIFIGYLIWG
mgnify:CR=1 FL=1